MNQPPPQPPQPLPSTLDELGLAPADLGALRRFAAARRAESWPLADFSINDQVAMLPKFRHPLRDVTGVPLLLPRTGLLVLPHRPGPIAEFPSRTIHSTSYYYAAFVFGHVPEACVFPDDLDAPRFNSSYYVGGSIDLGCREVATAPEVPYETFARVVGHPGTNPSVVVGLIGPSYRHSTVPWNWS